MDFPLVAKWFISLFTKSGNWAGDLRIGAHVHTRLGSGRITGGSLQFDKDGGGWHGCRVNYTIPLSEFENSKASIIVQ